IVGALRGIYEGHPSRWKWNMEPQAPHVQFGSVTLHLNDHCFRDGYELGQYDHDANQVERPAVRTVTATELLRYIAHYDPQTKQYSLIEEERSSLEEMLGRLVGYLCAALFPQSTKEHDTGPVPLIILQEA